jgi:L-serine dehydratase
MNELTMKASVESKAQRHRWLVEIADPIIEANDAQAEVHFTPTCRADTCQGAKEAMNTSLFDIFKIGIGPSSSHTVGPMRAARRFTLELEAEKLLSTTVRVRCELYGSLALTGVGHATDHAVLLGLCGLEPDTVEPSSIGNLISIIRASQLLPLMGTRAIAFVEADDLLFHRGRTLPFHPNGMRFTAFGVGDTTLKTCTYYSVGGGFILAEGDAESKNSRVSVPYPFGSASELLALAADSGLAIWQLMLANECALRSGTEVRAGVERIWQTMQVCTARGMTTEGVLPGGLKVRRRAPRLAERLKTRASNTEEIADPLAALDWVTVYAMAVNEENAAGGRVVTAPTNGAAGVVPAVAHYYAKHIPECSPAGVLRYFLTAAAIGILYKENASISGAEVGCQGEVGVACSMAAGGLVAALEGTNEQVEHAAEIGMEHNLGMTCDPIGGLVQIPCIERNAMGAVKAINACRMAMNETEGHKITLDQVIETMYRTGLDMQSRYKETSQAGLALNVIEC